MLLTAPEKATSGSWVKIILSNEKNVEYAPLLVGLGIHDHLLFPKERGTGGSYQNIVDITVGYVEYGFKTAKKGGENLLSLHLCPEDLEGLSLLWFPDREQGQRQKTKLDMWLFI